LNQMRCILPSELKERLKRGESLYIVDVREDEEVAMGMIPGATHIALGELPARHGEIPKDREVVLVCRSGGRSSKAYDFLESLGFTKTINMTGGMLAWDQD
jgi:rhodanese-related sulfurtransferase